MKKETFVWIKHKVSLILGDFPFLQELTFEKRRLLRKANIGFFGDLLKDDGGSRVAN